jgi:hypothetical protein
VSGEARPVSRAARAFSILLALLAAARMAWIVFTFGENNLSNDYIGRVPLVAAILEERYDFRHFFTDTFIIYGHSWLGLLPFYLLDARFFGWNMSVELGIGLALAAAKTLLFWLAIGPSVSERARWTLLPVLSVLAFSVAQVASFTFGESVLQMQLPQLGLALGAFALARSGDRPNLRILLVACGGLLASWSWGGGVMAWPVLVVALFALGERSLRRWCAIGLAAALGLSQYVWILGVRGAASSSRPPLFAKPWRFLDLIGRPFANGTGTDFGTMNASVVFGAAGLLLTIVALVAARRRIRVLMPACVVLGWSALALSEIGVFRWDVTPWYIVPGVAFWLGLTCLLAVTPRVLAVVGYTTIAVGLLYSNRTWQDKSFYLPSRSPASAACLREWHTAPVACHDRLFQWGGTDFDQAKYLGEPLERLHLSVFSSRRTYLLQGDAVVGRVGIDTAKTAAFLSRDGRTPGDPGDFHRLDLVLAPGAAVTWSVDLPPGLKSARFETRVRTSEDDSMLARGARVSVTGDLVEPAEARALVPAGGKEPLSLDLRAYAGSTVTLKLMAEEAAAGAPIVLEAPRIELTVRDRPQNAAR